MTEMAIFGIGLGIFGTYMFFLLRMIYKQHKKQAEETHSKVEDLYPQEQTFIELH